MDGFIGIAILILLFVSTIVIELRLKALEKQNERVIKVLEEIRDKR